MGPCEMVAKVLDDTLPFKKFSTADLESVMMLRCGDRLWAMARPIAISSASVQEVQLTDAVAMGLPLESTTASTDAFLS